MKSSARNQFNATVAGIASGAINDQITLALPGGQELVAVITRESTRSLRLERGTKALALVKASSVIVMTETDGMRLSARNHFRGKVSQVQEGAVNSEVLIDTHGGGMQIAAIVTRESASDLGLAAGVPCSAAFKASSVMLCVPG